MGAALSREPTEIIHEGSLEEPDFSQHASNSGVLRASEVASFVRRLPSDESFFTMVTRMPVISESAYYQLADLSWSTIGAESSNAVAGPSNHANALVLDNPASFHGSSDLTNVSLASLERLPSSQSFLADSFMKYPQLFSRDAQGIPVGVDLRELRRAYQKDLVLSAMQEPHASGIQRADTIIDESSLQATAAASGGWDAYKGDYLLCKRAFIPHLDYPKLDESLNLCFSLVDGVVGVLLRDVLFDTIPHGLRSAQQRVQPLLNIDLMQLEINVSLSDILYLNALCLASSPVAWVRETHDYHSH